MAEYCLLESVIAYLGLIILVLEQVVRMGVFVRAEVCVVL